MRGEYYYLALGAASWIVAGFLMYAATTCGGLLAAGLWVWSTVLAVFGASQWARGMIGRGQ